MSMNLGAQNQTNPQPVAQVGVFGKRMSVSETQHVAVENISIPLNLPSNFDGNAIAALNYLSPPTPYIDGTKAPSLSDYAMGPVLGIGTYGEVRSAIHLQTGKQVALKIVDLSRFRPDTAALMLKEISILRRLKHPNCISVMHVMKNEPFSGTFCGECACTVFRRSKNNPTVCLSCAHDAAQHKPQPISKPVLVIAQELAPGGELFSLLMHGGAVPEPLARYFFSQLLAAVEHCHSKEVVHRDIKPENIVFDRHCRLKLVDFGLAACVDDKPEGSIERTLAVLHSGVGSKPYSAPEVSYTREMYNATGYKGKPADIWSCAVVLFVMLTGRPPFYRPLLKTFNTNLQKCKHFARIIKGQGYEGVSPLARELIMALFRLNPDDRLTISQIRQHPWMTQKMDGPYGNLPVVGVQSALECENVYDHAIALMQQKAQRDAILLAQGKNPSSTDAAPVDYYLQIPDTSSIGISTEQIIQQRISYQNLVSWMRSRVRDTWAAMERPDMVHALETAFAQDESLALEQARNALAMHLNNSQQHHALNTGHSGSVFGVPPSPVVLPMQPNGMRNSNSNNMNNNGLPCSPSHSMLPPLSGHALSNHNSFGNNAHGTPESRRNMAIMSGSLPPLSSPMSVPNTDSASPIPIPLPVPPTHGSQGLSQRAISRDVAGTPLTTPMMTPLSPNFSLSNPAYSPTPSPALFSKLGPGIAPPPLYPQSNGMSGLQQHFHNHNNNNHICNHGAHCANNGSCNNPIHNNHGMNDK